MFSTNNNNYSFIFILFILSLVALGFSIWAIATPCKKDNFGSACAPTGSDWNDNLISLDKYNTNPQKYKNQCNNIQGGECGIANPPSYLAQDQMQCCLNSDIVQGRCP